MFPLRIAILWHFHQPFYDKGGELFLPWVRLHGVKDYWDLPELFYEFPKLKQTINLVPSLSIQIENYASGKAKDLIQNLSVINSSELTDENKRDILRLFFICNETNMIFPFPRYKDLYERSKNTEEALINFSVQDWLDIQVWYNLTWFGQFSRTGAFLKNLFRKGSGFTEQEKQLVLEMHRELLGKINDQMKNLEKLGQIEISCTPMYHPILPLLCDSKIALECMPDAPLPENIFKFPQDAEYQIKGSLDYFEKLFGKRPTGMWPSEGSLSNQVLNLMIKSGIQWTASDEEVLHHSLDENYSPLLKYFPWKYSGETGDISLFFRDHNLSDAIGFTYSNWNPNDAAGDFCNRLQNLKNDLTNSYGEECLKSAVVPVILDGENCWEFYHDNGIHFLRSLFQRLSDSNELTTVTFTEAVLNNKYDYVKPLNNIRAGSWINADFNIWFGHAEHRIAWSILAQARNEVEKATIFLSPETIQKAMEEIYISEGSDWFWWYGDSHVAPNKSDFDVLFRWHIRKVYEILGIDVPVILNFPLGKQSGSVALVPQRGEIHTEIDGKISSEEEWKNAGYFDAKSSMTAMHQIGELLSRLYYGNANQYLNFRIDTLRSMTDDDVIELNFSMPLQFKIVFKTGSFQIKSEQNVSLHSINYSQKDIIEFALLKSDFESSNKNDEINFELNIITKTKDGEIVYPRQGTLNPVL